MNKETAAAILTQIYFATVPNATQNFAGATRDEKVALASADKIGTVYGHFLAKLDTYATWGDARKVS